jgi:hypothetical protein
MAEESLLPAKGSSPGFQRYSPPLESPTAAAAPPVPSTSVKTAANGKAKVAHKRQISQAIPRNERDNGELSRPEAAAAASARSIQGGTQEGTQEGTRKSVRARKPMTRN